MAHQKDAYRQFISGQKDELPYSMDPDFLELVSGGAWDAAIVRRAKNIVGVWPYFYKTKWGISYITMPRMCKWIGPMVEIDLDEHTKQSVYQELQEQINHYCLIDQNHPYGSNTQYFTNDHRVSMDEKWSYFIDLRQSEDSLLANMLGQYRNKIRSFDLQNFEVIEEDHTKSLNELADGVFRRLNMENPYPRELVNQQWVYFKNKHRGGIFTIKNLDGVAIASCFLIWDQHAAYTHMITDRADQRKTGASLYLIWYLMLYAKQNLGLNSFDFEGSMIKSVEKVRQNFGAQRKIYYRYRRSKNGLYEFLRNRLRAG